jgi:protease I
MKKKISAITSLMFIIVTIIGGLAVAELKDKKIVMIIAHNGFRDEEYKEPRAIFDKNGIKVTVASSSLELAKGMLGAKVKPDINYKDIKVDDYDAVVFVGGVGAQEYWNDSKAQQIAKDSVTKNKLLAAICIAPVTLANAGVLEGKKSTVFSSEKGFLKAKGANYTGKNVEVDGKIITADGPTSAKDFGDAIIKALD